MRVGLMNRRNVYLGITAALFALMSVVPSLRAAEDVIVVDPESVGMSSERLQRINTFINEYIDANQSLEPSRLLPAREKWCITTHRGGGIKKTALP